MILMHFMKYIFVTISKMLKKHAQTVGKFPEKQNSQKTNNRICNKKTFVTAYKI